MNSISGCDYSCQRGKNIIQLKAKYSAALSAYQKMYQQYLSLKYDKSGNSTQSVKTSQTLLPHLKASEQKITVILNALKKNNVNTDALIAKQRAIINTKTKEILEKNIYIKEQDDLVRISHRQNVFSLQRNRYRRVMLIVLILINVFVVGLFLYLLSKR